MEKVVTMWNGHCRQKRGMRLKTSQGFFKGDWSPVEARNQKYPSGKICRKVGFLCFLFLLLAECRRLVLGRKRKTVGLVQGWALLRWLVRSSNIGSSLSNNNI